MNRPHDDRPSLDNYIEAKGTIFVTVQIETPMYASGRVQHLEIFNRPPTFTFEDHGQTCFVGNINGGDSLEFRTLSEMMEYLTSKYETWLGDFDELDNWDV